MIENVCVMSIGGDESRVEFTYGGTWRFIVGCEDCGGKAGPIEYHLLRLLSFFKDGWLLSGCYFWGVLLQVSLVYSVAFFLG